MKETAISAAMKRAGLNVTASALYVAAAEALRDKSMSEALRIFTKQLVAQRQLLDALALPFLQDVANDMKNKLGHSSAESQRSNAERGRGQLAGDTQRTSAASEQNGGPSLTETHAEQAAGGGGSVRPEAQSTRAAALPSISAARRAAAKRAAKAEVDVLDPIFKARRIGSTYFGNLRWRELQEIARHSSWTAAKALERSVTATENAFLCKKILDFATPADPNSKVSDIVPVSKMAAFMEEIKVEVPRFIAMAEEEHARRTLNYRELPNAQI